MTKDFKETDIQKIPGNAFHMIGKEWMLITAGNLNDFNTMTAAWGGFGFLWNKNVVFTFIRPQRHTFEFSEKYDDFTLTFFDQKHRNILQYCGTHSGRDVNKIKNTGLLPIETKHKNVFFEQAEIVIECKKIYFEDIKPDHFIGMLPSSVYPKKDYHRMYIGEVISCLMKQPG